MHLIVAGISLKHTPVHVLESLSIHHSLTAAYLEDLLAFESLQGAVILSTCNRLEVYAAASDPLQGSDELRTFFLDRAELSGTDIRTEVAARLYFHHDAAATRHLLRVVCGLESAIVGENEILGQMARAYEVAKQAGATQKHLNVWIQRALSLGKRARTEAGLSRFSSSVGKVAVDLAERELGALVGLNVLILGAGEVSELTVKQLANRGCTLVMVSNRSLAKAELLACEHGFVARSLNELEDSLTQADLVFSATASLNYLVHRKMMERVMRNRSARGICLIDMALPRDIDPAVASLAGVRYFDMDNLHEARVGYEHERQGALAHIAALIEAEVNSFSRWLSAQRVVPTICALRGYGERIRVEKLDRQHAQLSGLDARQRETVEYLTRSIINQLLHEPLERLASLEDDRARQVYATVLEDLFNLRDTEKDEQPVALVRAVLEGV
jgi:glutamyl-tRNA reductase